MVNRFSDDLLDLDANPIFDEDGEANYADDDGEYIEADEMGYTLDNRYDLAGIGFDYEDAGIPDDYDY